MSCEACRAGGHVIVVFGSAALKLMWLTQFVERKTTSEKRI